MGQFDDQIIIQHEHKNEHYLSEPAGGAFLSAHGSQNNISVKFYHSLLCRIMEHGKDCIFYTQYTDTRKIFLTKNMAHFSFLSP